MAFLKLRLHFFFSNIELRDGLMNGWMFELSNLTDSSQDMERAVKLHIKASQI